MKDVNEQFAIVADFPGQQIMVYHIREGFDKKTYSTFHESGLMEVHELKEGEVAKPLMKFTKEFSGKFFNAVCDYVEGNGLREDPDKGFTIGKLEATEKHLEDMQFFAKELLKKK